MPSSFYAFLTMFLLTVGMFIYGVATANGSLLVLAFASTLVLYFVRRKFLPRR